MKVQVQLEMKHEFCYDFTNHLLLNEVNILETTENGIPTARIIRAL